MNDNEKASQGQKIAQAIETLNTAAREKSADLKNALSARYDKAQEIFEEMVRDGRKNMKIAGKKINRSVEDACEAASDGVQDIHRDIKKNPWQYIGYASAGALILGFVLGASSSGRRSADN